MKHTTAAVLMLAICAAVTAFTIYITQSGWWIIAFVIAAMACQPTAENKNNSEVYPTSKYPQSKKQDIHLK